MSHAHDSDTTPLRAKVLTVSDGVAHGARDDVSGRTLVAHLSASGFEVVEHRVTADGADILSDGRVEAWRSVTAAAAGRRRWLR